MKAGAFTPAIRLAWTCTYLRRSSFRSMKAGAFTPAIQGTFTTTRCNGPAQ